MCSKDTLYTILEHVCDKAKHEFGDKLSSVVLYGSYARKEQDDESDIDVMVIVDLHVDEIKAFKRLFSDFSLEMDLRYDVVLSLLLQDKASFEQRKGSSPFFKNILREGVELIDRSRKH